MKYNMGAQFIKKKKAKNLYHLDQREPKKTKSIFALIIKQIKIPLSNTNIVQKSWLLKWKPVST